MEGANPPREVYMRKRQLGLYIGLAVAVIIVGVIFVVTRSGADKSPSTNTQASNQQSKDTNQIAAKSSITISNMAYSPATLTVKAGTKVTWTNQDGVAHSVTSSDGSSMAFDSGLLGKGQTYTLTFTQPGTYDYHCSVHPFMKGTVVVTR
jgi:amicyanin